MFLKEMKENLNIVKIIPLLGGNHAYYCDDVVFL